MISRIMMGVTRVASRPARIRLYNGWTSSNKSHNTTSRSELIYADLLVGDKLEIPWSVSSEGNYDWLTISINGSQQLRESGVKSGTFIYTATANGRYSIQASYSKDGSVNSNGDLGRITRIDQVNLVR